MPNLACNSMPQQLVRTKILRALKNMHWINEWIILSVSLFLPFACFPLNVNFISTQVTLYQVQHIWFKTSFVSQNLRSVSYDLFSQLESTAQVLVPVLFLVQRDGLQGQKLYYLLPLSLLALRPSSLYTMDTDKLFFNKISNSLLWSPSRYCGTMG